MEVPWRCSAEASNQEPPTHEVICLFHVCSMVVCSTSTSMSAKSCVFGDRKPNLSLDTPLWTRLLDRKPPLRLDLDGASFALMVRNRDLCRAVLPRRSGWPPKESKH